MYESEIKAIRTDNGTEFKNYTMQEFVDDEGIKHEFSAPYTPQQNGVVERKNRTIIEMARTMLSEFKSPHNFWGEAISTVYNTPTGSFYVLCITKLHTSFSQNSHAYRYYNKSTGAIEVSCDMVFLEDNGSQVEQIVPSVAGDDDPSNAIKLMGIGHIRPTEVHTDDQDDAVEMSHIPKNRKKALNPLSKTMMLIKKHPQPMIKLKLSLMIDFGPLNVHEALVDPDWVIAMQEELECFTRNEVWSLVERPKDHHINVIGTKWVFKNKQDENGIVIRNKVRKFEMSMMGELKFFLGFQVRQLAKGTFISQEMYVKDMLKKFNMTKASPMKTPMPVKGQLGSCDGEKDVDIKRGRNERPPGCRTSTRRAAQSSEPGGSAGGCMKNGVIVQPKAINKEELTMLQVTKYRFVVDTLQKMGLLDLVCLKPGNTKGIHSEDQFTHEDIAFCYPPEHTTEPRTISGMYYSYLLLAKIFRESLISKSGDTSECRAYHLNLMHYCRPENIRTIDGCDFLYCELRHSVRSRMTPNYARNSNDVAHQSLALNQETRRRQNEFMAARNHPVPPPGPEMELVVAPTWEMPPINDEMLQNFDLSLFAHGGAPPPPTTRSADAPESAGNGDDDNDDDDENEDYEEEDDDEDGDEDSPPTGTEFY
ncbi:hypothetical protein QYE76_066985 [Lolium multiflorum]|uniref:Integrase catalytic domain-containing protein n=1 Tax=Lolium multiflorum TaxID=4521 RepID=A0AAD8SBZ0_LOLMU|nr:hypothetical protein QYE76_066985 [Lolium multiflorum]